MEGTTFDLREYKLEQDKLTIKPVDIMPDSWKGRARIAIRESDSIPQDVEQSAIGKALALSEKKGVTPKVAAEAIIRQLEQRKEV